MADTSKSKRNYLVFWLRIGVAAIVLIGVIYFFFYPKWVKWNVESLLDTSIPNDAENVQYTFVSWQGSSFDLRFDYPPSKVPDFLANTCFSNLASLEDDYMMFGSRWWNPYEDPDGKRIWVGGACTATYGGFLDIVVDMTNSSKYTIYVTGGVS